MTDVVTASELAAMRLPDLPASKRGINLLRTKQRWQVAEEPGPFGAELILVSSLPADLQAAIAARRAAALRPVALPTAANDMQRRVGRPAGTSHFDAHPDQAEAVLSYIAAHKHSAPNVLRLLAAEFDDLPDLRTLQRYIAGLERQSPATLLRQRDPDAARNRHQLALGRADATVTYAHEAWELDTTKVDVMTKGGRCMVLGVIDRWSRRVKFIVAPSESGLSVRRLLIATMLHWGVMPAKVVTDNGSGYVNASVVSGLATLGIEHERCLPGSPERKPFVERLFGTFMRSRAVLLDGFTGHNVAEASRIRAKAKKATGRAEILAHLTTDELQVLLDQWVDGTYHLDVHSTLRMSPMQKWMATPEPAAAAPTRDQLELALSALVGPAMVGKRGVQWKRGRYWCAELAAWIGRQVIVRRDEEDLGELLIFDADGHFIGRAIDHQRAGISEREFAMRATAHQKSFNKAETQRIRDAQRAFPIERARDAMIRDEAERAGKLVTLPTPTIAASTAQLDSMTPIAPVLPSAEAIARAEAAALRNQAPAEKPVEQKVAEADAIVAAAEAGQDVAAAELNAARAYRASAEYRATKAWLGQPAGSGQPQSRERSA